jgi:hypothetical protein
MICSLQKSPTEEEKWQESGIMKEVVVVVPYVHKKNTNLVLNSTPSYFALKSYVHFKFKPRHLNFKHVSSCGL